MAYTWITPKTDWTYEDKFTFTDYNRIRNNLLFINEKINTIFPDKAIELDLGEPKTDYSEEYHPSEFNAFEDAIESFKRTGKNYSVGERYYHYDNDPFVWDDVLNHLEKCALRWKEQVDNIPATRITVVPHGEPHRMMYLQDSALFDVTVEPSNATHRNDWTIANTNPEMTFEKISDTQVKVTYVKGAEVKHFRNGIYPSEKLFMTPIWLSDKLKVEIRSDRVSGTCDYYYTAQGSYTNNHVVENDEEYALYYKFTKVADNVDGRGITTFVMTLTDIAGMPFGLTNRRDNRAPWRASVNGVINFSFSSYLLGRMELVSKLVMASGSGTQTVGDRLHLPSYTEFGSSSPKVASLGSAYPYLSNNELYLQSQAGIFEPLDISMVVGSYSKITTRSLYQNDNNTQNTISSSRTSYIELGETYATDVIHPFIFLPSNLKVVEYYDCYKIDWNNESDLTLADIPLGSIVLDVDGTKGNLTVKNYIEAITLNKTSITMHKNAVQTININVTPANAINKNNLRVEASDKKIGLDYSGDTITVKGLIKGVSNVLVVANEFPNQSIIAECEVTVQENQAESLSFVNTGTSTVVNIGTAYVGVETTEYDVLVTPSNVETIDQLTITSSDTSKLKVAVLSRNGNRVRLKLTGVAPASGVRITANLDGVDAYIPITIIQPSISVSRTPSGVIRAGNSANYTIAITPSSYQNDVRFSIATISGNVSYNTQWDSTRTHLAINVTSVGGLTAKLRVRLFVSSLNITWEEELDCSQ